MKIKENDGTFGGGVEDTLEKNSAICGRESKDLTSLMQAARDGNAKHVKSLLDELYNSKSGVESKEFGESVALRGAKNNNIGGCEERDDCGLNVTMQAAKGGHKEVLGELYFCEDNNLELTDNDGNTPLMHLITGYLEVVGNSEKALEFCESLGYVWCAEQWPVINQRANGGESPLALLIKKHKQGIDVKIMFEAIFTVTNKFLCEKPYKKILDKKKDYKDYKGQAFSLNFGEGLFRESIKNLMANLSRQLLTQSEIKHIASKFLTDRGTHNRGASVFVEVNSVSVEAEIEFLVGQYFSQEEIDVMRSSAVPERDDREITPGAVRSPRLKESGVGDYNSENSILSSLEKEEDQDPIGNKQQFLRKVFCRINRTTEDSLKQVVPKEESTTKPVNTPNNMSQEQKIGSINKQLVEISEQPITRGSSQVYDKLIKRLCELGAFGHEVNYGESYCSNGGDNGNNDAAVSNVVEAEEQSEKPLPRNRGRPKIVSGANRGASQVISANNEQAQVAPDESTEDKNNDSNLLEFARCYGYLLSQEDLKDPRFDYTAFDISSMVREKLIRGECFALRERQLNLGQDGQSNETNSLSILRPASNKRSIQAGNDVPSKQVRGVLVGGVSGQTNKFA